ncbi:hypothetical protein CsSME_00013340 [Camellia sinensis var. sinensis]
MACLQSVWCLHSLPSTAAAPLPHPLRLFSKSKRLQVISCGNNHDLHQNPCIGVEYQSGTQRRQVLFQTVLAAFSFPPILSLALADSVELDFFLFNIYEFQIHQGISAFTLMKRTSSK